MTIFLRSILAISFCLLACDPIARQVLEDPPEASSEARIIAVTPSGSEGAYSFSVELSSPDTGCEQYADWWEVVSDSGSLLYRRILTHSHVNEQPFTRSGSPIPISADQLVWVRVHMNNTGYSEQGVKGSVAEGFEATQVDPEFATDLDTEAPLPDGCAF